MPPYQKNEVSVRVAYQGEPGAFSEAAVLRLLPDAEPRPYPTFDEVFDAVSNGSVNLGVVPIENSIGGSIHRNYDLLVQRELSIVGEVQVPVVHHLLALPGVRLEDDSARAVASTGACAVCGFLRGLQHVEAIATYDTAGSAKMVRDEQRRDTAAIASERAGTLFGLESLRGGIQDYDDNITRFLAISRQRVPLGTPDKTSLVFTLQERTRRPVQGAECVRAARHRSVEARIAAGSWTAMGIPVLSRRRGSPRRSAVRAGHGPPGGVRPLAANARLISALA